MKDSIYLREYGKSRYQNDSLTVELNPPLFKKVEV
jgi:hypothetical protein